MSQETSDWLDDLRQTKSQLQAARDTNLALVTNTEQLRAGEERILTEAAGTGVEELLLQFRNEILRGHPLVLQSELERTVSSIGADGVMREPAPWSGPADEALPPLPGPRGDGRYLAEILWKLDYNYQRQGHVSIQAASIKIVITGDGVRFNDQLLVPATQQAVQSSIATHFQNSVSPRTDRIVHRKRHRHRKWYKRWQRTMFPDNRPTRYDITVGFVILVVAVLGSLLVVDLFRGGIFSFISP